MYLRTVSRAVARSGPSVTSRMACLNARPRPSALRQQQTRFVSEHAIANPTLAGIEKRWEEMPPQEQAELYMQLRDRMKVDWHEMTLQEKKAGTNTSLQFGWSSYTDSTFASFSLLDLLWRPWTSCERSPWRRLEDGGQSFSGRGSCIGHLRHHAFVRQRASTDNDQGMARGQ
jgi:hypothetical protein